MFLFKSIEITKLARKNEEKEHDCIKRTESQPESVHDNNSSGDLRSS